MDTRVYINEGVPLKSANIFVNAGKGTKVNARNGTAILPRSGNDGVSGTEFIEINANLSMASSKKIKVFFTLNFCLSVLGVFLSCCVAYYFWTEIKALRRQIEIDREDLIMELKNYKNPVKPENSPLKAFLSRPEFGETDNRDNTNNREEHINKRKSAEHELLTKNINRLLVTHYTGQERIDVNLGTNPIIGPWRQDQLVSSKNSESLMELTHNANILTVKEDGLYMLYAQVVYITNAPSCYFIWARQPESKPRLLSSCNTADVAAKREATYAQLSCPSQTVARLYRGDEINFSQREQNRTISFRPGFTYFGFIKISQ